MTASYAALVPIIPIPPIQCGSSRHNLLALDRVDQWRLEPIRQGAQFVDGAMAAGAAHDQDMVREVDPICDFVDIVVARDALGRPLEVTTLGTEPSAAAAMTSCGSVKWATPRPAQAAAIA